MARYWGKNLKIDGSVLTGTGMNSGEALAWEAQVQDVCRKIETAPAKGTGKANKTGALLMKLILECSGKNITILPLSVALHEKTAAKATDWSTGMKSGYRFHCPQDEVCTRTPSSGAATTPHSDLISGRGGGSDVRVFFHPSAWTSHDQVRGFDTMADNIQPDDVLFHELFHALRFMKGLFEEIKTGDTWEYTEEMMAVIATNVYVSELGRGDSLRGSHSLKFESLKDNKSTFGGDLTVGRNFYNSNFKIVDQIAREMPDFTGPLEKTDAASRVADWNPFRERILFDQGQAMFNSVGDKWDMMSRP